MSTKIKSRVSNKYGDARSVGVYSTEAFDHEASFASQLIEKWGLVAAMPDGEDSAGRAKLRLPTTEELVTRAFDISERFWAMARERGHSIALPDLNEVNTDIDEKARATEEARRA